MTNGVDVKQSDRVLYLVGGEEFPAIARAGAHAGVHPGTKLGGVFLTLTYLNASGQPVQVLNAPLIPAAATDDDVKAVTDATVKALEQKTLGKGPEPDAAAIAAEYRGVKAEVGWRPFIDGEDVAKLKAYAAGIEAELNATHTDAAQKAQQITALAHENEQLKAHAAATVGATDAEKAAQDSQHEAEVAQLKATIATLQEEITAKDQDNAKLQDELKAALDVPPPPIAEGGEPVGEEHA
jgi:hypothetical protein